MTVNEAELVRVAIFNLDQAARRIEALAGEARAPDIAAHLRGLADTLRQHASALRAHDPTAESR